MHQSGCNMPLISWLFPRFCVSCQTEGVLLCKQCEGQVSPRPAKATCPFCRKQEGHHTCSDCQSQVYLDGHIALTSYANKAVRKGIEQWKYYGDRSFDQVIEQWVIQRLATCWVPYESFIVAPVPLHKKKKRLRGFDQAGVFAGIVGRLLGREVHHDLLVRIKKTAPQARRGTNERLVGDLDEFFKVRGPIPEAVCLCDDVFTSGATMDAAAKALKEAGVRHIWGISLAKGS